MTFGQGLALFLDAPVKWVNAGNINVSGSNITLEALIRFNGSSTGNVISKHSGPTNTNYLLRTQSFEITTSNGHANLANPMILQPGVTYHIAATYNGSMMRYYVNGCLTAEQPWSGTLVTNSLATAIGQQSFCQCEQFVGFIDEARVWNVTRSEAQIRNNMYNIVNPNLQFNLLAYFKFQNNFNNLAGFSPTATSVGGPSLVGLPYPYPSALAISHTGSNVICHNSNTGAINIQASGGIQPYEFSLDGVNFQSNPNFNNLSAGNYTIYTKSNDNCIVTATRTIQNKTPINLNLNDNDVSCNGNSDGSATVLPNGGNGPNYQITWSNNQSGISVSNLSPGNYSVTVKDSCRAAGSELVVNGHFEQGPTGFTSQYNNCTNCLIGIGEELYENQFVVGINANHHHVAFSGIGQGGGGNFMMVNGSSQANTNVWCQTITVLPNTYYEFSAWVTSIFTQSPAQLQFQANGQLLGPIFTAPTTANTWNQFFSVWFSSNNTSVNICILNQNTATAGNDFGIDNISFKACLSCEVEQTFIIEEPAILSASATTQNAICGTNTGSIDVSTSGGTAPYSFSIDGVNFTNTSVIQNLAPGSYMITVQDASNCTFIFSALIGDDDDLVIDAGLDQSICLGETVTLNASGPSGFTWSSGVFNNTPFVPNNSAWYVVSIDLGPTCYASDSVFITVHPLPLVDAGADFSACSGENITLSASGALTFSWSNGVANGENFVLIGGNYSFTVIGTDANGCSNTDEINVIIFPSPNVSIDAIPTSGFVPLTVNFQNNNLENFDYFWNFGAGSSQIINSTNTQYTFNNAGQFWVVVSAEDNGCSGSDSLLIEVSNVAFNFEVPNVFSPNGDENNPFFQLIAITGQEQVSYFELLIFNRWGNLIQVYDSPNFQWDGIDTAGMPSSEGVYFYKIHYQLQDKTENTLQGFFHLVLE